MRTRQASLNRLMLDHEVDILISGNGAVIYYKNTSDSDIVPFDDEITLDYFIDNFEMVADLSKLQLNLYALND